MHSAEPYLVIGMYCVASPEGRRAARAIFQVSFRRGRISREILIIRADHRYGIPTLLLQCVRMYVWHMQVAAARLDSRDAICDTSAHRQSVLIAMVDVIDRGVGLGWQSFVRPTPRTLACREDKKEETEGVAIA